LAAIRVRGRVGGVDPDRLIEGKNGEIEARLTLPDQATIIPAERILGIDEDRFFVVGGRPPGVAPGGGGLASCIKGTRIIGAELDGLAVVGNGLVVVALVVPVDAAVVV